MKRYQLYLFDLDGTLYRGKEPMPHARETLQELRRSNCLIRFLTNNSSMDRASIVERLSGMGIDVWPDEAYGSALGAAKYCVASGYRKVFVVGEQGLFATLRDHQIETLGPKDRAERVDAVVAGICRSFDYAYLDQALQLLLAGAAFVATNLDPTYPLEKGRLAPGAGSMISAIQACSSVTPIVVGKPQRFLIDMILKDAEVLPSDTLVVGDRLDTDIAAGKAAGCDTFLVLTGVTNEPPPNQPYGSLADLIAE